MKFYLSLLYLFLLSICEGQTTIYVSTAGNDSNSGRIEKPLKSIHAALGKIANANSTYVEILLRAGTYYSKNVISITPTLLNKHSLTISAFKNESVVLSGAFPIHTTWNPVVRRKGLVEASIEKGLMLDQLICNGRILHMARYPNYNESALPLHGTSPDVLSPNKIKKWANPKGAYIHALHNGEWGGFHFKVIGKIKNDSLALEGGWQNNRPAPMHKEYRYVENIFEELDAPGEWYYDSSLGKLYLYPPLGVDLKKASFERSILNDIIHIVGNENNPAENVEIFGISFEHTNRTFMLTKEPLLRSDWTVYRGGAVLIEGARNVTVDNCQFKDLGGNAVFVSKFNRNVSIRENIISHIGGNGIAFVGDTAAVRSPSFRYENFIPLEALDKTPGPKSNNYPSHCDATENLIYDIGKIEKQVAGVEISMSSEINVSHNTIYDVPRAGINIGDGCWGGHTIQFNDVFNTVLETGDHGAFNSWGRDRYWHPDYERMQEIAEHDSLLIFADAIKPTMLFNNRFRCDHGWDIDLDDGSSNYIIANNVCLQGGLKLREGFNRKVENNIMINNSFHPHVWFRRSYDVFTHNIVLDKYKPIMLNGWGDNVDFNFFPDSASLFFAQKNSTDVHSVFGNPEFIDPFIGNYQVRNTSSALELGFINFSMNEFGVTKPKLKRLAKQPTFTKQLFTEMISDPNVITGWFGASLKKISGLNERSATGMKGEEGVYITQIEAGSTAEKFGLRKGDVILKVDGEDVYDSKDVFTLYNGSKWKGTVELTVFRGQQLTKVFANEKSN